MTKIVINDCFGGFSLSDEGTLEYAKIKGIKLYKDDNRLFGSAFFTVPPEQYYELEEKLRREGKNYKELNDKNWYFSNRDIPRDDSALVEVIERMGDDASGRFAKLKVVEVPDDVEWVVEEYDGTEWVAEKHRTWN